MFKRHVSQPYAMAIKKRGERFKVFCLTCEEQMRRIGEPLVLRGGINVRVTYFCETCQKQHDINLPNLTWGDSAHLSIVTVTFK